MVWNNLTILIENNFFCFLVKNFKYLLPLLDNSVHKAHVLEKYHLYENLMFWETIFRM